MISHCLWQIYIRLCSFQFFWHNLTTFTTHLQDSYHDISKDCVVCVKEKLTFISSFFFLNLSLLEVNGLSGLWLPDAFFWVLISCQVYPFDFAETEENNSINSVGELVIERVFTNRRKEYHPHGLSYAWFSAPSIVPGRALLPLHGTAWSSQVHI